MIHSTKIKMKTGSYYSDSLTEIDQIYLIGCSTPGYYKKEAVYDHLITHPHSIQVDIYPYPDLVPAISSDREKYVRSEPNYTATDNLLRLPRE